jgi:hypothetical protein
MRTTIESWSLYTLIVEILAAITYMSVLRCKNRYVNCALYIKQHRAIYRKLRNLSCTRNQQMAGAADVCFHEGAISQFRRPSIKWFDTVIIIIIIIVGEGTIFFMQGIYTYIPETNHVPKEYNVAAILSLLFMAPISLVRALVLMYFLHIPKYVCSA